MGKQIQSMYAGICKTCKVPWAKGDTIFYSKEPKISCSVKDCFMKQGGTLDNNANTTPQKGYKSLTERISDMIVFDSEVYKICQSRLKTLESEIGEKIPIEQKLVFIESWARTIAMQR